MEIYLHTLYYSIALFTPYMNNLSYNEIGQETNFKQGLDYRSWPVLSTDVTSGPTLAVLLQ